MVSKLPLEIKGIGRIQRLVSDSDLARARGVLGKADLAPLWAPYQALMRSSQVVVKRNSMESRRLWVGTTWRSEAAWDSRLR